MKRIIAAWDHPSIRSPKCVSCWVAGKPSPIRRRFDLALQLRLETCTFFYPASITNLRGPITNWLIHLLIQSKSGGRVEGLEECAEEDRWKMGEGGGRKRMDHGWMKEPDDDPEPSQGKGPQQSRWCEKPGRSQKPDQ
ncbi:unnamed protein product [Leuciscus chuanchicus]